MKPLLVFDYDGTIHNTILIYEPAFRGAYAHLVKQGLAPEREIPTGLIKSWLGMNVPDMWNSFMPELLQELKLSASLKVGELMVEEIKKHSARWYLGIEEQLGKLKSQGYEMVVLSNCKTDYRDTHWKEFNMGRWFSEFYDCESFGYAPKTEIIHKIREKYGRELIVIGDRASDFDCAKAAAAPFVGCLYGFGFPGELDGAEALISSVSELTEAINKI